MSDLVSTGGGQNHPTGCTCPFCTSTVHGEPALVLSSPSKDDIDFARETLGEDARDADIRDLAEQRADRDAREHPVPAPISAHDVDVLRDNRATFENGYTPEDAAAVLAKFDSAQMTVFWDRVDTNGDLYGDSFFAGVPAPGATYAPAWDHHMIHDDVWAYLSDPDFDGDPSTFTSLLEPAPAHINGGELYTFDVAGSTQHAFEADPDTECGACGYAAHSDQLDLDGLCEDCQGRDDDEFVECEVCQNSVPAGKVSRDDGRCDYCR